MVTEIQKRLSPMGWDVFLSVSPKFSHFKSPFALPSGTQRPAEKTANAAQDRTADMHRKTVSTLENSIGTLEFSKVLTVFYVFPHIWFLTTAFSFPWTFIVFPFAKITEVPPEKARFSSRLSSAHNRKVSLLFGVHLKKTGSSPPRQLILH